MRRFLPVLAVSVLSLLYRLTQALGLMATDKSANPRELQRVAKRSKYWRLHGWLMLISVVIFSPFAFSSIYDRMAFLRQNRLLLLIGFNRYYLMPACAFATLWIHCSKQAEIVECLNRLLQCRRRLRKLLPSKALRDSLDTLSNGKHLIQFGLLVVSIMLSTSQPLQVLRDDPEVRRNFTYASSLVFVYACQLILQLSLGIYTLALLFLGHLVCHSNQLLARILDDAGRILKESLRARFGPIRQQLYREQQHWLALELWRLIHLHGELLKLQRCISSLYEVQVVCFVVNGPMECMVHLFFTYFMRYSKFILRKYGRSFPLNFYAIAFMTGLFGNLLLVILPTYYSVRRFARTREILKGGVYEFPAGTSEKRLKQTLHYYGLFLKNVDYMFTDNVCGLFKLNNALLFCIVGAMLNYLMILIQFDKVWNK
ncbi:hypothetical protein KR009_007424 [Drosophila setifemur]|nr:hypothetical protein KR009_007424 [Drosophila setifemur]